MPIDETWHYSSTHLGRAYDIGASNGDNVALIPGPDEGGSDRFLEYAGLIADTPRMARKLEELRTAFESFLECGNTPDAIWLQETADSIVEIRRKGGSHA